MSKKNFLESFFSYTSLFILLFVSSILALFYYFALESNLDAGFIGDDAAYLLMADNFQNKGESIAHQQVSDSSIYPLLYSLYLTWWNADSTQQGIAQAHIATTVVYLIALFLMGIWLIYAFSFNKIVVWAIVVFFASLPTSLRLSLGLWSEFLYLFLSMAILCLAYMVQVQYHRFEKMRMIWFLLAVLVGLTPLVRSIGIAWIISFIIFLWWHKPRYLWLWLFIALIPFIGWTVSQNIPQPRSGYLQHWHVLLSEYDLIGLFSYFLKQFLTLFEHLLKYVLWYYPPFSGWAWLSILFLPFVLIGIFKRFQEKAIDPIYLLIYLVIVLLWPYPDHFHRFIWVVTPLLWVYFIVGAYQIKQNLTRYSLIILFFLIVIVGNITSWLHFSQQAMAGYADKDLRAWMWQWEWFSQSADKQDIYLLEDKRDTVLLLKDLSQYWQNSTACIATNRHSLVLLYLKTYSWHQLNQTIPDFCNKAIVFKGHNDASSLENLQQQHFVLENILMSNDKTSPLIWLLTRN